MHCSGINGRELREQSANASLPGKWPLKRSVCHSSFIVNDISTVKQFSQSLLRISQSHSLAVKNRQPTPSG